jgi:hypothetical protein
MSVSLGSIQTAKCLERSPNIWLELLNLRYAVDHRYSYPNGERMRENI